MSDRDFVVEALAGAALAMVHLSRLAEEITWWSNPRFGFVRVADAYSTGSSMMPNKRNPDPAELVRGRAARVIGALTGTLTMLKGSARYQRDLQEDKPALFDAAATHEASLAVMAGLIATIAIEPRRMAAAAAEGYTTATAVADALVERGRAVPGRPPRRGRRWSPAAETAGIAWTRSATRPSRRPAERRETRPRGLGEDPARSARSLGAAATVHGALARFDVIGGTAPGRVAAELLERAEPVWALTPRVDTGPERPHQAVVTPGARGASGHIVRRVESSPSGC